jgi:hypothetical protein
MNDKSELIIIPCFVEEDSIQFLLMELRGDDFGYSIIVVDDGSNDI